MPQSQSSDVLFDLSVLHSEPAEEYHAKAKVYLGSHGLIDYMECPKLFRQKQLGLIPDEDTTALFIGTATHCRILEGLDAYKRQYAVGGPINRTTGKPFGAATKAFAAWSAAQGKPGIHFDDADLIENLAAGVACSDEAIALLGEGRAEGVLRAKYCGIPCQIRIDWANPYRGIVDLKTIANLKWLESESCQRSYHHQAAFYQAVLALAAGRLVPVHLIAVEKRHPFRCGIWRIGDDTLARARRENEAAIRRLQNSIATDHWPTGYEEIRLLEFT